MADGKGYEHIEAVRWVRTDSPEAGESTVEEMVDWIGRKRTVAYVRGVKGSKDVPVQAIHRAKVRSYIKTKRSRR